MKKLLLLSTFMFLLSCSSVSLSASTTSTPYYSITSFPTETSAPPTNTPTYTIQPSLTPSITPTKTSTATITPTPFPTLPPLPTLNRSAADSEVINLMRFNSGCSLPCWWGIVPGKTSFQEAVQFLERLGGFIESSYYRGSNSNEDRYLLFLHNPGTDDSFGAHIGVVDGVVNSIRLDADITRMSFQINQILTEYGTPNQILIREYDFFSDEESDTGYYHEYDVVLHYADKHFLAWFEFGALRYVEPYLACVGYGPYIEIWSSNENRDIQWIQEYVNKGNSNPYFNIEEVSSLTPASLRTQLLSPGSNQCFDLNYDSIRSSTIGINPEDLDPTPTLDTAQIPFYLQEVYQSK